jgi:hypothetical protein
MTTWIEGDKVSFRRRMKQGYMTGTIIITLTPAAVESILKWAEGDE